MIVNVPIVASQSALPEQESQVQYAGESQVQYSGNIVAEQQSQEQYTHEQNIAVADVSQAVSYELPPLPENWMEVKDAEGDSFYYNTVTQESVWHRPTA